LAKRNGCPLCGKPTDQEHQPFCGQGCRDRDLLQWLGEGYRVPGDPVDPETQTGLDRHDSRD